MTKRNLQLEREWQRTVIGLLELFGCVVERVYPLRTQHGWRSGCTLKGRADLVAYHPRYWILHLETKGEHTRLEPEQAACLSLAAQTPCVRAWVVRPDDPPWADLQQWVRRPKLAPPIYGFEPVPDPRRELVRLARTRAAARQSKRLMRGLSGPTPDTLPGLPSL